jgi:hypothetical protein
MTISMETVSNKDYMATHPNILPILEVEQKVQKEAEKEHARLKKILDEEHLADTAAEKSFQTQCALNPGANGSVWEGDLSSVAASLGPSSL